MNSRGTALPFSKSHINAAQARTSAPIIKAALRAAGAMPW